MHKPARRAEAALEQLIPYKITVLSNRLAAKFLARYGQKYDLSVLDWRVMAVIGPEPGISAKQIVDRTDLDKPQVSRAVSRMMERGLIAREVNNVDRRLLHLRLTPAGYKIYRALWPEEVALEKRLVKPLTQADVAHFNAILDRLHQIADEM